MQGPADEAVEETATTLVGCSPRDHLILILQPFRWKGEGEGSLSFGQGGAAETEMTTWLAFLSVVASTLAAVGAGFL